MKKGLLKYLLGAVVLLIVFVIVGKKMGWIGKPLTTAVYVEKPEFRTITESITANGKIQPEVEVKISSEVSGEIIELPVKEGDWVEKGSLLCRIKPDTYISMKERAIASVNSANARLLQSKAQLAQAELSFKRSKQLYEQKAISESEFETAKTNYEVAQAELKAATYSVESAEASLKEAEENLKKTTIYSPISGTVSKLNVELGERVVGTIQMAGTEIMRIANLNRMEARVDVNENDIVKVEIGDTALIEVDAYLGRKFKGVVTQIANTANVQGATTDQVTNFEVRIFILESSYKDLVTNAKTSPFRPGMSTTVEILTNTKQNVLTVPILAVTTRIDSVKTRKEWDKVGENNTEEKTSNSKIEAPKEIVFVAKGDTARIVEVKTGIQDNQYIEIIEGLSPDDEVVSAPYSAISRKLKDKSLIRKVKTKEELFKSE
ncbi:efflux RND transporter periplasmic adaptor subunit [Tenuifilum thalassicum]|uniref:Efflux RND transporter periplasmic adaptor subunit n=1 Tax=Tenuifilum thalassicum TaxID=2590900 RepID=A0A7D4BES4_9BACT|nr:efflux RND transporter periplasmic adaptor subunit [Tenuifilum thalassicum]QKG81003.1 efflux RND transporter periplasmic adaptor subunit [Tenuifilum thalassicum]